MFDLDPDQLFERLMGVRKDLDKKRTRYVRDLTPDETEEITSLVAEGHRLNKLQEQWNEDLQALGSRTTLFWYRIKRTFDRRSSSPEILKVNNDNTQLLEVLNEEADHEE